MIDYRPTDTKIVYRRYASLFFIAGCDSTDNELITLEVVHRFDIGGGDDRTANRETILRCHGEEERVGLAA